jgi:hypothetical protein
VFTFGRLPDPLPIGARSRLVRLGTNTSRAGISTEVPCDQGGRLFLSCSISSCDRPTIPSLTVLFFWLGCLEELFQQRGKLVKLGLEASSRRLRGGRVLIGGERLYARCGMRRRHRGNHRQSTLETMSDAR